ncbi:MAG TPA: pirin family protein [Actinomycetota bacterium]|nr:pirin family protein [Actinomycetota bacterium]
MIVVRRDPEIHDTEGGWFRARWHFSFDDYYDPAWTQFGSLRVFNDDRLIPGAIWPLHPHRDVEGLTYVVEGVFRHADDIDRDEELPLLPAGSVQRMTLGSGAWHSEQNGSQTEPMRFIQIWILPAESGLPPSVEQRVFTTEERTNRLLRVISGPARAGDSVLVHQDAAVYVSRLEPGVAATHEFEPGRGGYLYVIEGDVTCSGESLGTGDAMKVWEEPSVALDARTTSELIMVEVRVGDEP